MATEKQRGAIPFYSALMEEFKERLGALNFILYHVEQDSIPRRILEELGYLQLRMMCELTAIGCLVAHGDIAGASGLKGEYAADKIMNALERLHPDFFPKPVRVGVVKTLDDGRRHLHFTTVTEGVLNKDALISLYRKCGDALHVGSLNKLGSSKTAADKIPYIIEQGQKLATTLNHHSLVLLGGRTVYICVLRSEDQGGRVQTVISQAIDEVPPEYR